MQQKFLIFLFLILHFRKDTVAQNPIVQLDKGIRITSSCSIQFADYNLDAPASLDSALVTIEGKNITVDLNNSLIHSTINIETPDRFRGLVIMVRNSENVTIKNARIHGYKIAVRAENVKNLTIENCDFSYNHKQRLNSTQEREDVSDRMTYLSNEQDEWLHYGSVIYLRNCDDAIIQNNKITNSQCALMMTSCNYGKVFHNNFSFNSGTGIGLYRSSFNEVMYNTLNFNIRGFSFGIYNGKQDGAAILVYEQSSSNTFAYNTATHCGNGIVLLPGSNSIGKSIGECSNNQIFGNDFSDASGVGVRAAFSSNNIINNRIDRCRTGIAAVYCYYTLIALNQMNENDTAISFDYGRNNHVMLNKFINNQLGIRLAADKTSNKLIQTNYPINGSANYWIESNEFNGGRMSLEFTNTDSVEINHNEFTGMIEIYKPDLKSRMINFGASGIKLKAEDFERFKNAFAPDPSATLPAEHLLKGKEGIIISEWGPYNFKRPFLKLTGSDSTKMYFKVYGPFGKWRLYRWKGIKDFSRSTGLTGDTFSCRIIKPLPEAATDILLELEYIGEHITDEFGLDVPVRTSSYFSFERFELPLIWKVEFFKMDTFHPARNTGVFKNAIKAGAKKTMQIEKLEFIWSDDPDAKTGKDHFAIVATAAYRFGKGNYSIGITADDGVRFYVDDKLIIDAWDATKIKFSDQLHHEVTVPLEGIHRLKLEYYDYKGLATLMFSIKKK